MRIRRHLYFFIYIDRRLDMKLEDAAKKFDLPLKKLKK